LDQGALHISLPEVNVWIDNNKNLSVSKTNRESPGRMLIAEVMIMANWLMAKFLADHNIPAIFRSQPEPKERLFKNNEGSLYQNWMQRKYLNRFMLSPEPEHHSGLGLEAYVTATSPIRKYFDLVTQRQIRAALGLEKPYSTEQVQQIIQLLETPMSEVWRIQYGRNRYWLLKYLKDRIGQKEEAIVLSRRKNNYLILLTEYMLECNLPLSSGINLKPEDMIQVTLQHVNARKDILSVYLG
jgi:exoribonuclease-2